MAADGTVFATIVGNLLAVDASSGRIRWRGDEGEGRPAVRDGTVYVASFSEGLIGYDTETGEESFSVDSGEFRAISVTAAPECLVVGTDSGLAAVEYDGTIRWQFTPPDLDRDHGTVAVTEGVAYAGFWGDEQKPLVAVDIADGTERWRSNAEPEATPQFAPPAVADGVVYVPVEDKGLAAVDAADGHVRWRFSRGERGLPYSPAAIVGEILYVLGNGHLYALEEA